MKVKYTGNSCISLTHGKEYEVLSIENGWYRIIDDTGEDYLFPADEFEEVSAMRDGVDMMFSENQIAFMKSIGISVDFSTPLSDTDYADIEEKVSKHLQKYGFDDNYLPSEDGKLCESILDLL